MQKKTRNAELNAELAADTPTLRKADADWKKLKASCAPAKAGGHTPGPWTRKGTRIYYQANAGGYRFDVAEVFRDVGAVQAEANADFILRACNSHDALLAALKECKDLLSNSDVRFMICDGGRGHLGEQSLYHRTINAARAAIAQAEKGTP